MSTTEINYIPSTNGSNQLHVMKWKPEGEVKAILQISHGMIEHIGRYDDFAKYLNSKNILVVGNDHLGHGKTVHSKEELGYFNAEDSSQTVVNDLYEVTKYTKALYPNVPYFILGHSMGSFMARRYLMTYGRKVDGAIIMGTGYQSASVLKFGELVYKFLKPIKGTNYRSKLMKACTIGRYNKAFAPNRTSCDWLATNQEAVDIYMKDEYCQFDFTINGYNTIINTFKFINQSSNIAKIPKDLPILFVAGKEDPVGDKGEGVKKVYTAFKKAGISNMKLKLYSGLRHEILNEVGKEEVYQDIYKWLRMNLGVREYN
ncbi:alpha/beta fold hydrolase [Cellulosilyticum ruminicola]|uniref:alpha/beta fold hydrolase n=1 Tax=Cellulosilyticum ruminicola TaxID=425254 RepID=UPI0006CFEA67|nr:alpha/beta fold hydrolase [Cellulosilyticum ruminicola]